MAICKIWLENPVTTLARELPVLCISGWNFASEDRGPSPLHGQEGTPGFSPELDAAVISVRSPLGSLRVMYLRSLARECATQKGLVSSRSWCGSPQTAPGRTPATITKGIPDACLFKGRLTGNPAFGPAALETGRNPRLQACPGVTRGSTASSAGSGGTGIPPRALQASPAPRPRHRHPCQAPPEAPRSHSPSRSPCLRCPRCPWRQR